MILYGLQMTNYIKKRQLQNGRQERVYGPSMMSNYQMFRLRQQFKKDEVLIDKAIKDGVLPSIHYERS